MSMLKFFKKQTAINNQIIANNQVETDVISIDEKIYNDVYSAQELLLNEADNVLSQPFNYDEERYNILMELNKLGFSNAVEIKEFNEIDNKRKYFEKIKEKIKYYNFKYPFNKFITVDNVKTICKKYGLYLTEVRDYIAEIPEKNQKEIVNFKVKQKDYRYPHEVSRIFFPIGGLYEQFNNSDDYYNRMIPGQDLLIIAPEHKLDMKNKVRDGHILKIKDPIVLQPVEDGYLIVSSWGFEAGDELVVNNINN